MTLPGPGSHDHRVVIGPVRQELRRDGTADDDRARVRLAPLACELPHVAGLEQMPPCLLGGGLPQARQHIVGHAGPARAEALTGPCRGELLEVVLAGMDTHVRFAFSLSSDPSVH
jgi:hypothetical protein